MNLGNGYYFDVDGFQKAILTLAIIVIIFLGAIVVADGKRMRIRDEVNQYCNSLEYPEYEIVKNNDGQFAYCKNSMEIIFAYEIE